MKTKQILTTALVLATLSGTAFGKSRPKERWQETDTSSELTTINKSVNAAYNFDRGLVEGSFKGVHNGKHEVHMMTKAVPGREGSYFALLVKPNQRMSLYLIDQEQFNSYVMTPLEVTTDGIIGIRNEDPSLALKIIRNKHGQNVLEVTSANSGNNSGVNGNFIFYGEGSSCQWQEYQSGEYALRSGNEVIRLSGIDPQERKGDATFYTSGSTGGHNIVLENQKAMFLFHPVRYMATGREQAKYPRSVGIFFKSCQGVFSAGYDNLLIVNPSDDKDIKCFQKH